MSWKFVFIAAAVAVQSLNLFSQNLDSEVILTIGNDVVTRNEFERIFQKNNQMVEASSQKTVDEYLELFINYKLKVAEAKSQGLDKKDAFIKELDGYRKQLTQPYLIDQDSERKLLDEAYQRMRYEVSASHILISVPEKATPTDTLAIYNKVLKMRERIIKGESFEDVARGTSDDSSVKRNSGFLGYFTAFQMVYPFESAAYKTPVGKVSMPVRTTFGYHLIKVHDIRPAKGQIKVAHIMIATSNDGNDTKNIEAKNKIDELHKRVINNEDFAALAREFSQDPGSARNGGELPLFGSGRMVPEFEQAAFSLQRDGQISSPIRTQFGWHIIKRIEKKEIGTFEEMLPEIKQKMTRDSRTQLSRRNFITNMKIKNKFSIDSVALKSFVKLLDSSVYFGQWKTNVDFSGKTLFQYDGKKYSVADLAARVGSQKALKKTPFTSIAYKACTELIEETIIASEESRLDRENPDFFYLMKEYYEGILLFEITDQNVWGKSSNDNEGLTEFYNKNIGNYLWDKRFHGFIFTSNSDKTLKKAQKLILSKKGSTLSPDQIVSKFIVKSDTLLKIAPLHTNVADAKILNFQNWQKGLSPISSEDGTFKFIRFTKVAENEPKPLSEVRGQAIADYQEFLEKEWLALLRQKYTITINHEVLEKVKQRAN
jgi:peptidyl-prolyl cis-trans isomerase SurA